MAFFLAPDFIIRHFVALKAEANFNIGIFFYDGQQSLRVKPIGANFRDACLWIYDIDQVYEISLNVGSPPETFRLSNPPGSFDRVSADTSSLGSVGFFQM